jgi:hypothetical protein
MDEDNERHFNFNKRLPKKAQTEDDFEVNSALPFSKLYHSKYSLNSG